MNLNINSLLNIGSQHALSYGEKLIGTIQKNKIGIVAFLALGCLAAYLYKRMNNQPKLVNNQQPTQVTNKTSPVIDIDQAEKSTPAKTHRATNADKKHRESELFAVHGDQEWNKEPILTFTSPLNSALPSPKAHGAEILDDDREKDALNNSDSTSSLIDPDPVEIQNKPLELREERRKLIVDAVQQAKSITELGQFLNNEEDLIDVLNASIGFRAEKILKTKSNGCFVDGTENFLLPLFSPYSQLYVEMQQKFDGDLVGIAARHVKGHLNRLYLAIVLKKCHQSIVETSLTKDEIIEFLEEIKKMDKLIYGDQPGYKAFDEAGSYINETVFHSIAKYDSARDHRDYPSNEWNTKRLAVFKEFYAKSNQAVTDAFKSAIHCHDRDLLKAVFDVGYQDSVLPLSADDDLKELEEHEKEARCDQEYDRIRSLMLDLGEMREYEDYYRLKETIELLIEKGFLALRVIITDKPVESTHQLIRSEYFTPSDDVLINMLESSQCDLPTLKDMMENTFAQHRGFGSTFESIMSRAVRGIACSLQACQFLHDHYSELEDQVRKDLARVLKRPEYQTIKQTYFDDVGI